MTRASHRLSRIPICVRPAFDERALRRCSSFPELAVARCCLGSRWRWCGCAYFGAIDGYGGFVARPSVGVFVLGLALVARGQCLLPRPRVSPVWECGDDGSRAWKRTHRRLPGRSGLLRTGMRCVPPSHPPLSAPLFPLLHPRLDSSLSVLC